MSYSIPVSLSALALALLSAFPAQAQTATPASPGASADAPSSAQLVPVIITATRSARALTDVPVSASVVTAEQIEDTAAQSLDDVLRHVAGVNLPIQTGTQAHPTADNISMRGLGGIHALVLVDGVPMNDPFFGYIQWGRIPMENIDHVEVVRGGGSPLWGNYAMGGAVNVITRTARTDTTVIDAGAGTYGTYRGNLYGSYGLGAANRLTLNLNLNGTDGFMAVPDDARRPFDRATSFSTKNFQLSDRFQASDDLVGDFSISHHENNQVLGTALSTNSQDTTNVVANVKKTLGAGETLTGTLFHGNSHFVTSNPTVTDATLPLAQQTEHTDNVHTTPVVNTGGSAVWSRDVGGLIKNITLGADFSNIRGSDSAAIFDQSGTTQIRTDVGRGQEAFAGAFVQASITPVQRLEILASGRLQNFQVLNGYDGNPGGVGAEPNRSYTSFDPRLSLRYGLTDQTSLRAAWYQAFRAPTLDNLYRGFASDGGIYYPNSQLKPETLTGGEIGIDFIAKDLRTQFTLYRTEISNLITTANLSYAQLPAGFFYGGRLVNAASAQAQGFEAEADWKIGGGFTTTLAYTFADSVYKSNPQDPASVGQQLTDVPRNTLSAALTYQSRDGWRISTDARYISATSWASADHTSPGVGIPSSADPHLVVDLAARYPVRENTELSLQIQNLLNRRYIVNPGPYNPPQYGTPFQVFVGLRITLD